MGFAAFRVAYTAGVGAMLHAQRTRRAFTAVAGVEAGYRRFRRIASTIMNTDGIFFVALCVATMGTLNTGIPAAVTLTAGIALAAAGVGIKLWAAKALGDKAYYWYDFFEPASFGFPDPPGPYRWLRNPMYTAGYLHCWGLAVGLRSFWGLLAAALAHTSIMTFFFVVERPHVRELMRRMPPPVTT